MKKIFTASFLLLASSLISAQGLYIKTFGSTKNQPLLFLHGGPGYNCVTFEATTAQKLADKGFYVIVYDRRGEGRSPDTSAQFTFRETFDDLNSILLSLKLDKVNLIGHSFGGIVATLYAEKYPEKVNSIILVSAPVVLQETFRTIIKKTREIYQKKKDTENLEYLDYLESMDTTSIDYSSYCFRHAMQNGFYTPPELSNEAQRIYFSFMNDTLIGEYGMKMTEEAPIGFLKNEKYTCIDLTPHLKDLLSKNMRIYGLYGKDDGLYSKEQVMELQNLIGKKNLEYLDNCSHNVFIDQQTQFMDVLKRWMK